MKLEIPVLFLFLSDNIDPMNCFISSFFYFRSSSLGALLCRGDMCDLEGERGGGQPAGLDHQLGSKGVPDRLQNGHLPIPPSFEIIAQVSRGQFFNDNVIVSQRKSATAPYFYGSILL
jgi:hypothetical protein